MSQPVTEQPAPFGGMSINVPTPRSTPAPDAMATTGPGPQTGGAPSSSSTESTESDLAALRGGDESCLGYWCQSLPCCADWDY